MPGLASRESRKPEAGSCPGLALVFPGLAQPVVGGVDATLLCPFDAPFEPVTLIFGLRQISR